MIPQMEKNGYPRVFATNLTITASVQALLVPPSHNAVLYSLATGGTISISALFMAGVFPGLLLGFSLIILCLVIAYRNDHPRGQVVPAKDAIKIIIDAAWASSRWSSSSAAFWEAFSRRSKPALWRASGRFSSRCSSTATIAGATCRFFCIGRCATVAMVLTLIACAFQRRLHHGADADAGQDDRVLPVDLQQ